MHANWGYSQAESEDNLASHTEVCFLTDMGPLRSKLINCISCRKIHPVAFFKICIISKWPPPTRQNIKDAVIHPNYLPMCIIFVSVLRFMRMRNNME